MGEILKRAFGFDIRTNSLRNEILAGITTFLTMAYILAVNPAMFGELEGMPIGASFTATAIASIVGTLLMAFMAKKPYGLAPGMGINAFFVYTVCIGMGYSWNFALTAVFLEGIVFIILTATKLRKLLIEIIPQSLKNAMGVGIGIYIAFIGMQNAGFIVANQSTVVGLGDLKSATNILFCIGLLITSLFVVFKIRGGILLGMLLTTIIGWFMGVTKFNGFISLPDSIAPIWCKFEWKNIFTADMFIILFTFLINDIYDTIGTVVGVSVKTKNFDKDGKIEKVNEILMADAIATVAGAACGTSTTTTYLESAAGVAQGGRTGLTAFVIAVCFIMGLFFSPVFLAIPGCVTGAVLVIVGVMMMSPVKDIDWEDYSEAIPSFITAVTMTLTYNIVDGIMLGIIAYVLINGISRRHKVSISLWILAAIFIFRYAFVAH